MYGICNANWYWKNIVTFEIAITFSPMGGGVKLYISAMDWLIVGLSYETLKSLTPSMGEKVMAKNPVSYMLHIICKF